MTTSTSLDYTMAALGAVACAQAEPATSTAEQAELAYARVYAILAVAHELRVINDTLCCKNSDPIRMNR